MDDLNTGPRLSGSQQPDNVQGANGGNTSSEPKIAKPMSLGQRLVSWTKSDSVVSKRFSGIIQQVSKPFESDAQKKFGELKQNFEANIHDIEQYLKHHPDYKLEKRVRELRISNLSFGFLNSYLLSKFPLV